MAIIEDLAAARVSLVSTTGKLKAIVDGPASGPDSLVETEAGPVRTEARRQAEAIAAGAGWETRTEDFEALAGGRYKVSTAAGAVTATLPADFADVSPPIQFEDADGTWGDDPLTIDGNGHFFEPVEDEDDEMVCDVPGASIAVSMQAGALIVR